MRDDRSVSTGDSALEYPQTPWTPPPGATEVLLVRHGASEPARPDRPFPRTPDGHGDPGLAPEGHRQARRVADRLAVERIDALYVTSLRRTAQTAEPLAARLGLTPRVEHDLREVHLGAWEAGLFRHKVAEDGPLVRRFWQEQRWDVIPGAESPEALRARVRAAIGRLATAHPDGRVAVFTHGGVIAEVLAQASGSRPFAFIGADNGSVSTIVVTPQMWVVRRFNDAAHLHAGLTSAPAPPT